MTFWFVKYHHGNILFCIFRNQSPIIILLMLVYRNLVADIDLLIYDQTYKLVPVSQTNSHWFYPDSCRVDST